MRIFKLKLLVTTLLTSIFFTACKKNDIVVTQKQIAIENPFIRKDANFPNGVLQFNSTASIKLFYENAEKDPEYVNKVTGGFKTFKAYMNEYNLSKYFSASSLASSPSSKTDKNLLTVDSTEFVNDMKILMLPIDDIANLVNNDMEVIVADTFYQFTRIGLFKVNLLNLSEYLSFYNKNKSSILFDKDFSNTQIPNDKIYLQSRNSKDDFSV